MSKKAIIPAITLVTLLTIGIIGSKVVSAEESLNTPPIVQRIAETFGLKEEEVEAVFDAVADERKDQMQQYREQKLEQAVSDGVITEEQKTALQNKWQEMEQKRQEHREEMQVWFEEQGIDPNALREYGGFGHH